MQKTNKIIEPKKAYEKLAALCARRECCLSDLAQKLYAWGIETTEAEEILMQLEGEKFVDEARYARAYVEEKLRFQGWGRKKLRVMLGGKRISNSDIQSALSEINEQEYRDILCRLVQEYDRSCTETDAYKRRGKIIAFAQRRGYELDLIMQEVDRLGYEVD